MGVSRVELTRDSRRNSDTVYFLDKPIHSRAEAKLLGVLVSVVKSTQAKVIWEENLN